MSAIITILDKVVAIQRFERDCQECMNHIYLIVENHKDGLIANSEAISLITTEIGLPGFIK